MIRVKFRYPFVEILSVGSVGFPVCSRLEDVREYDPKACTLKCV